MAKSAIGFVYLLLVFTLFNSFGCSSSNFDTNQNSLSPKETTDAGVTPVPPPNPATENPDTYLPLIWEKSVKQGARWSVMIYQIINTEESSLIQKRVNDIQTFCPRYENLSSVQKVNFWGQLIASMARFESGWNPTTRYIETKMGLDPVTGQRVVSEGLLQLSYQDAKFNPSYCDFDWSKDKILNDKNPLDPKKTIFDPYKNLRCGIRMLARQIRNKNSITLSSGAYWSVLQVGNSNEKIDEIATMTKSLSFCQ